MKNPKTLYHYCRTSIFHKIIDEKKIRLSSLSLSNDSTEGKLIGRILENLSNKNSLSDTKKKRLLEIINSIEHHYDGIGFCLSEDGDLLSQWRGYADDGKGVSIGFSKDFLEKITNNKKIKLNKVSYSSEAQKNLVEPTFNEALKIMNAKEFSIVEYRTLLDTRSEKEFETDVKLKSKNRLELVGQLLTFLPNLYAVKHSAFKEEVEWRLVSLLGIEDDDDEIQYSHKENCIVPFEDLELPEEYKGIIDKIILGPKHLTPINIVRKFLESEGFVNVEVIKSEAPYR